MNAHTIPSPDVEVYPPNVATPAESFLAYLRESKARAEARMTRTQYLSVWWDAKNRVEHLERLIAKMEGRA